MSECAFCEDKATRTCDDCGEPMCDACSWDDMTITDMNITPSDCCSQCAEQYEDQSEEEDEQAEARETVVEALQELLDASEELLYPPSTSKYPFRKVRKVREHLESICRVLSVCPPWEEEEDWS